jgi:hypothetical protein
VDRGISVIADSRNAAMGDQKRMKGTPDGAAVNTDNVIRVEMEDLSERDWNDLEFELQQEQEMEEVRWLRGGERNWLASRKLRVV